MIFTKYCRTGIMSIKYLPYSVFVFYDLKSCKWKQHENFSPCDNNEVEKYYHVLKIKKHARGLLVFGITDHALRRITQRKINNDMVAHTLKYGLVESEGPQKFWDIEGRKVFTWKNMVVVTNYNQNRIVTVYWKIDEWSNLKQDEKNYIQMKTRRKWCKKYARFYNKLIFC